MPSDGMARWFSIEMAKNENSGICANFEFLSPDNYLKRFAEMHLGIGCEESAWDKSSLRWVIFEILGTDVKGAEFKKIRNYFKDKEKKEDSARRYLLAGKIADLYDQYFIYRPEMIGSWKKGVTVKRDGDEKWQMELFRKVSQKINADDRVDIYEKFIEKCKDPSVIEKLRGKSVLLFGISSMSRYHLDLFHALSQIMKVELFFLSPSDEYWAYVRKKKNVDDPESNRFLSDLGKSGRVFMDMLYSIDAVQPETLAEDEKIPETDLEKIRRDINEVSEESHYNKKSDGSVVINGCWGKMREVEVLKDQLLEAFDKDHDLKPSDILVMTPDIQGYAPYIRAVFDRKDTAEIPYSIGDVSVSKEGEVIPVFLKILHLIGTAFKKSEVFSIFEKEAVHRKFRVEKNDLETIKTAVEQSGIRWGVDRRSRENMGFPPYEQNSWRFGIDRMILGYAMKGEGKKVFSGVMPYDEIEGASAVSVARFITFTEQLFKAVDTFSMERPVYDWSARLNELVDEMFEVDPENSNEIRYLRMSFDRLRKSAELPEFKEAVSWKIILNFLEEFLTGGSYGRGFINGNVTFCSMRPMRAIPFKVVCMIGMNDEVFPGQQTKDLFDLITKYPRPEDRNNAESNRYFFLESLVSARNRLIISYNAKSVRDSSDNLMSSPVKLLKDYLDEKKSGFKEIIQPLQPFSAKYFEGKGGLFTYSSANFSIAQGLAGGSKKKDEISPLETDHETDIELDDIIGFFINPARSFFRKRLGVTFPYIQEKIDDSELFSIGNLEAYSFKNELIKIIDEGGSVADFKKKMQGEGKIPHGPAGKVLLNGSVSDVSGFIEKIRDHKGGAEPRGIEIDSSFQVRSKKIRIRGKLEVYDKWQVFYRPAKKAKHKDKIRIWLYHLFLNEIKRHDTCFLGLEEDVFLSPVDEPKKIIEDLLDIYFLGMERPLPMTPFIILELFEAGGADPFAVMLEKRSNTWSGEQDDHAFSVAAELSGFYEARPKTVKMLEDIAIRIGQNYKRHETVMK